MSLAVSPDGSTVTLSWFDYTPAPQPAGREAVPLYAATSHDRGQTFGAPVKITDHVCVCCMPEGIVRGSHPAFVLRGWVAGSETDGDLRNPTLILSKDAGDTWWQPITIHDDGFRLPVCPHVGFGADVDRQQRIHVAWWTGAPQRAGYWYTVSDTATTFAAPYKLLAMSAAPHGNSPSLVIDSQETVWIAVVTFAAAIHQHASGSSADMPATRLALWTILSGQAPRFIEQAATPGALPKLAAMTQGVVLVWVEGTKVMLRRITGAL